MFCVGSVLVGKYGAPTSSDPSSGGGGIDGVAAEREGVPHARVSGVRGNAIARAGGPTTPDAGPARSLQSGIR
jgi:hypothetical protein